MHKLVIVINGSGGVGKDSICSIVGKHYSTMNISSVDPIKKIAFENGWDGRKNEKSLTYFLHLRIIIAQDRQRRVSVKALK